ncbi:hypothetical protein RO3G_15871 [Rhizopus delemar RA 99-880]|uniref:Uncharacterized protein n=1 Tax=Rhizopus delemar (strain RA 99-880 / ATCC MYA-4621 / FGSC 9543 / NRRL 43880) TaxID=246409 RepID=I1CRT0_RHIO9|nr:hypothetical protein RO3G_15871 [Rhizopus delemar RA 99-880]|eukprot:EIE91160.1 hypothetical protein RO3G_15871 [Rhizopus delemar RA 99-880]
MPYNVDRIVNEIRNYNRTVNVMRSEFEAWKNEIQQQMTELKLMIERNNFINYPLPQAIYQQQPPLFNSPALESGRRDIPRFPTSLGDGQHSNTTCIEAFIRETMDLLDKPEDSNEILDNKRLLAKKYHSQLNSFAQVICIDLSNKLLADVHIDKNKLSWKYIPVAYKNTAYKELEEFALRASIPLGRCVNSWGAQVLLAKSYGNYYNKKLKNKLSNTTSSSMETNTHLAEQTNDTHPDENFDFELLPDLDSPHELEEGNGNEINIATSLSSAVSLLPPSPRSSRTRSGTRTAARRSTKKRRI